MTAIGIVWSMLLDPNMGLIAYWLKQAGLETIAFLKDPKFAMPTVIVVTAWKGFGYTLTLLAAAVLNISQSLYEAAEMDGAGSFCRFIHITIPGIWPTISFCIVTSTIGAMQMFDQAYVMTQEHRSTRRKRLCSTFMTEDFRRRLTIWGMLRQFPSICL